MKYAFWGIDYNLVAVGLNNKENMHSGRFNGQQRSGDNLVRDD